MSTVPWTEKYRPYNSKRICGNEENLRDIRALREKCGSILVYGPPGTGKTTSIRSILNDFPKEQIFTFDMSLKSSETCKNMTRLLNNFIIKQTESNHKIVVVDEIDCMRVIDQKVFKCLLSSSFNTYSVSVMFLCNNIKKVSEFIIRNSKLIEFKLLEYEKVKDYLEEICSLENINVDHRSLEYIFNMCDRDLRKMLTTMQYIYKMTGVITKEKYKEIIYLLDTDVDIEKLLKLPLIEAVDYIYYQGKSVLKFIDDMLVYHKEKSILTKDYIKKLAEASNDAKIANDSWFIICFIINESPIYNLNVS